MGLQPANERVEAMYEQFSRLLFGEQHAACSATLAAYRERLERVGVSVNVACLIPHGNIRCAVMGLAEGTPSGERLARMCDLVERGMHEGAFGLSTGLVYPPGAYAETEELVALSTVVARSHGIYATHLRDEGSRLVESVTEALTIGAEAGVAVQISHHKAVGPSNWGKVKETLALIDQARARGLTVHSDVYPYTAGSTGLAAVLVPQWAFADSHAHLISRLTAPATRQRIVRESQERLLSMVTLPGLLGNILKRWPKRWLLPLILRRLSERVVISSVTHQHQYEGKTLRQVARLRGQRLYDALLDLLVEEDAAVMAIAHTMCEEDVREVMRHAASIIGTDGFPLQTGRPHPRTYGTYPRVLAHYVRETGLLELEEAVHRMTGLPATALGLTDRGTLTPGAAADVVIFDPQGVQDRATYENPRQGPEGIPHVFVGGVWTVRDGKHTGARAGRVLRQTSQKR